MVYDLNRQALDAWITSEPRFEPFFHSSEQMEQATTNAGYGEPDTAYTLAFNNFDELRCNLCAQPVGFLLHDDVVPPSCSIVEFWQMDEDGESLMCSNCYEEITKEIG